MRCSCLVFQNLVFINFLQTLDKDIISVSFFDSTFQIFDSLTRSFAANEKIPIPFVKMMRSDHFLGFPILENEKKNKE